MSHQHPRVEEVSDSDDPEEMDIDDITPAAPSGNNRGSSSLINPANIPMQAAQPAPQANRPNPKEVKEWALLYPLYFDASKTRAEGRRVGKEHAVPNPLARGICDAVARNGLRLAFEAQKTHPRDWANPGRVRVKLKENGKPLNPNVHNKHHLYLKVAEYLKQNPANDKTPLHIQYADRPDDMPMPPPPAVPRGWKMNKILPLHSDALSGGGVSENMFKDMMNEMQGGGGAEGSSGGGGGGGGGKSKKDKKKAKG